MEVRELTIDTVYHFTFLCLRSGLGIEVEFITNVQRSIRHSVFFTQYILSVVIIYYKNSFLIVGEFWVKSFN